MKKFNYILITIGIIFIVGPYFFTSYHIWRLVFLLVGIIMVLLGIVQNAEHKIMKVIIYLILLGGLAYFGDFLNYYLRGAMPILSIEKTSSDKVGVYNSFFYRIYSCDQENILDLNYKKSYACGDDDITIMPINKMLENPQESYKEYKGKFIHLQGKINTIKGNFSLSLNAYTEGEEKLNGYVVFDEEKKVIVEDLNLNPSDYYIYDYVEVIGLVSSYKQNGDTQEIYLKDAVLLDSDLYNEYELVVNDLYNYERKKITDNLYYVGLEGIYYKYTPNDIYELGYLLSDKRESVDNLIKTASEETINEDDKLYPLEKYKIIKCANKDTLFVSNYIYYYDNICETNKN